MNIHWAAATHQGRMRSNNEDTIYPTTAGRTEASSVFMVADGMGGHVGGEIASSMAVEAALTATGGPTERVEAANRSILAEVGRRPQLNGMGTTLTLVEVESSGMLHFAHVGDSRAYLLRGAELGQLTSDHTVMAEYLRSGSITPEEVATHPQRAMMTRAVGLSPDLQIDGFDLAAVAGDRILLCSDGVTSMIDDEQIGMLLRQGSPEETVWALIEAANRAGGHDNISAVVIDFEATTSP